MALCHIGLRPYLGIQMEHGQKREVRDKFMLRFPDGMRDRIKDAAAREGRSMNAQIVQHLSTIYQPEGEGDAA